MTTHSVVEPGKGFQGLELPPFSFNNVDEVWSDLPGRIVYGAGIGLIMAELVHCDLTNRCLCGSWCGWIMI